MYRDYIVLPEKRKELLNEEQAELARIEKEIRERYNPDNLFKNHDKDQQTIDNTNVNKVSLTKRRESIFTKIKNWLKQIFNK